MYELAPATPLATNDWRQQDIDDNPRMVRITRIVAINYDVSSHDVRHWYVSILIVF
jgi:hypothetical protein